MVSFDVVSLFTSIPLDVAKQCTEDLLLCYDTDVPAAAMLELIGLCLERHRRTNYNTQTTPSDVSPSISALSPTSTVKTDRTPEIPLPSPSSITSTSAAAPPVLTTAIQNQDTPININLITTNTSDVHSVHISPHCDRILTSLIGLVGHLRTRRTETDEPVPGAPTYTRRFRFHCPQCTRIFAHRMGLFSHMCIHESGIDRSLDTPTTSNTPSTHSPTPIPSPCAPIATTTSITDTDTTDLSCPHCRRTFTLRIGLIGHLRIHRKETAEPVSRVPTYIQRTYLHFPNCPRTSTHRMDLFGHMRIYEILR
nr:unnamed protein product [Spirometra erinaceieuropaei]